MSRLSNNEVEREYRFWISEIGENDPYKTPDTLGIHDVLRAHFLIAEFFVNSGEGFGGVGPRSKDLLHSAVSRQLAEFGGVRKWNTKIEICSTLFFGLIKDHPFVDANKRTAFLCLLYHLQTIGLVPSVTQTDLEDFAVRVANNELGIYNVYERFCDRGDPDAEVKTIVWYLKKNTRRIDKKNYIITFRQLKSILNRYGYDLQNPHGNLIDIVRIEERRKIFGRFRARETVGVKVCQIGFPGWTKQVSHSAIKTVRYNTKLTYEFGVDSAAFFQGADPIDCLIAEYQEPLLSLAHR